MLVAALALNVSFAQPYGKVATAEDDGSDGKQAVLTFTAEPGKLAHFGPVEVVGNKSVSDRIIRRHSARVSNDVRLALVEAEDLVHVQSRVHAGQHRDLLGGRKRQVALGE